MSSSIKKASKKIIKSPTQSDNNSAIIVQPTSCDNIEANIVKVDDPIEKKKRGRKKQNVVLEVGESVMVEETVKPPPKKRGRKPKGGKIIQQSIVVDDKSNNESNVILHLKCSLSDINNNDIVSNYPNKYTYSPNIENIQSFHFDNTKSNNFLIDEMNNNTVDNGDIMDSTNINSSTCDNEIHFNKGINYKSFSGDKCIDNEESFIKNDTKHDIKNDIWEKLSMLKVNLHNNNIYDKRSACFWCTHDFDNPPIFIPKNEFKDSYQVYGCFCSPECSVAHLMNEKIDSSIKFERYQLLNHIYGKIYNYTKNIKPAPDPHYVLEKFYGTLSIKEYRELFKTDQLLIVVDKPLTHVFPELYEDNSDFILNQRTIPSNSTLKLKRKNINVKKTSVLDTLTANQV